jgi:pilus assembly protein CpaB
MIEIPREVFIEGYFTDMANVVGRQARVDLEANMLLTSSMVVESADQLSSTGSIAALTIPKGMVAISIPINRLSSVSYAPQAGDHVNVIASMLLVDTDTEFQARTPNYSAAVMGPGTGILASSGSDVGAIVTNTENRDQASSSGDLNPELTKITAQNVGGGPSSAMGRAEFNSVLEQTYYVIPSEPQRPRLVSQTLLQDAIVLGVGDFSKSEEEIAEATATDTETPAEGTAEGGQLEEGATPVEEPKLPDLITLIVAPQDAVTLNYLIYSGAQLTLALRSAGDDTRVQTEAATLDFLLTQYNVPVPVKLPYGLEPRIDELASPQLPNDAVATPEE